MENRIWDYTSLDLFLTCRMKYYWRIVRDLEPKRISPALSFGSAIHSALDSYYTKGLDEALKIFRETYEDIEGEELRTIENGVKLLVKYAEIYKHEPFKVLGKPEIGFVFPIEGILWGGRIDLPVEWGSDLYPMEHKTTSKMGVNYFKQFTPNMQITSYCAATEEYFGRKCNGCVVNAMEPWKEVKRKSVKTKEVKDHFARHIASRTQKDIEKFKHNVVRIISDVEKCEKNREFYPNEHACRLYNTSCPYSDLCTFGDNERFIAKDFNIIPWEPYKQEGVKYEIKSG